MKALQTAVNNLCQTLGLDPEEVQLWLDQHLGVPLYPQVQLLRLANKYQLDPLSDEIALLQNQDQTYQPFITIDGWSKLINNHPQYAGMSLRDSTELIDGIPTWMECTIYATLAGLPAISLPAGFHPQKPWPMGIQLIGKPQGDAALLQVAASYEAVRHEWLQRRPPQ